jgi:hypothetical protein
MPAPCLDPDTVRFILDDLFVEWKRLSGGRRLFSDGPVDCVAYCTAPKRVVFVLKEVNETTAGAEWDLRQYVRDNARGQTWNNVVRWTRTIIDGAAWDAVESVGTPRRCS